MQAKRSSFFFSASQDWCKALSGLDSTYPHKDEDFGVADAIFALGNAHHGKL